MIISKTAAVTISPNNVEHYKKLGYKIPMRKASRRTIRDTGKEYTYCYGEQLIVKVEDLLLTSRALVDIQCDICGEIKTVPYVVYTKSISNRGYYTCQKCKYSKAKITNMEKYGVESPSQLEEVQNKMKETWLRRYGYENPGQAPEIKKKILEVNRAKYGVDNPFQLPAFQQKTRQTMIERYGKPYTMQVPEFFEKAKATNLERYGNEYAVASEEIRKKSEKTLQEKYGCTNVMFLPEMHEKAAQTMEKRYGTRNVWDIPEIQEKYRNSIFQNGTGATSSQQNAIFNIIKTQYSSAVLNYPIGKKYFGDIVIDNIDFEVDYGGHNLSVKRGNMTQEEFDQKQLIRDKIVKSEGYKIIRLIADKERRIPSDSKLLEILEFSKQYFNKYPNHSWIEWHLDDGFYRNAEHKDGVSYDFGELHKIKKAS